MPRTPPAPPLPTGACDTPEADRRLDTSQNPGTMPARRIDIHGPAIMLLATVLLATVLLATVLLATVLIPSACRPEPASRTTRRDGPATTPQRIVSLAPAITEIVFALGLGPKVVGVTRFCTYPPEARERPRVGGFLDLNLEAVVAARPDLVILTSVPDHDAVTRQLDRLDLETLQVDLDGVAGILGSITTIADACGSSESGLQLRASIEARLDRVAATVQEADRPGVLVVVGRAVGGGSIRSVWAAGPGTFYNELLELAGGHNLVETTAVDYPELSREAILALDPDIILDVIADLKARQRTAEEALEDWQSLPALRAVRTGNVRILAHDFSGIPGPRIADTAQIMARALHPELEWAE